jgi:hypothetical protein
MNRSPLASLSTTAYTANAHRRPPRDRSARRAAPRWVFHLLTLAIVAVAAVAVLWQPIAQYTTMRKSHVGVQAFEATATVTVTDLDAQRSPLISRDSMTLAVFVEPGCEECRANASAIVALTRWASAQGAATRLLAPANASGLSDFARLAGAEHELRLADPAVFDRLGLRHLPAVLLIDRRGIIRAKWIGRAPTHLALLNLFARPGAKVGASLKARSDSAKH